MRRSSPLPLLRQVVASPSDSAASWAEGKHIDDVVLIKNTDIARHLSLPPVKLHCSMLAEDAIKAAVSDYKQKQAKANKRAAKAAEVDVTATPSPAAGRCVNPAVAPFELFAASFAAAVLLSPLAIGLSFCSRFLLLKFLRSRSV